MSRIGEEYCVLPNVWSVQSQRWRSVDQWSWRKKPHRRYCKGCHVTGYDAKTDISAEERIGREACHGPGRGHADSSGQEPVVNPAQLTPDRRDMACVARHARGTNPSGEYNFPAGYVAGETNGQVLRREFREWKKKREQGEVPACEVCAIPGISQRKDAAPGLEHSALCLGCHELGDRYTEHTRHAPSTGVACLDCHVLVTPSPSIQERETSIPTGTSWSTRSSAITQISRRPVPLATNNAPLGPAASCSTGQEKMEGNREYR